jgi:hypothetical protein
MRWARPTQKTIPKTADIKADKEDKQGHQYANNREEGSPRGHLEVYPLIPVLYVDLEVVPLLRNAYPVFSLERHELPLRRWLDRSSGSLRRDVLNGLEIPR